MIAHIMDHEQGSAPAESRNHRRQKAKLPTPVVDRLPPSNEDAERACLGCVLLDPMLVLPGLIETFTMGSEVFYSQKLRKIYDILLTMYNDGIAVDTITLISELQDWCVMDQVGGRAEIASLPDAASNASNWEHYANILVEKYTLRKAIGLTTEFVGQAYERQGEVEVVIEELEVGVRSLIDDTQRQSSLQRAHDIVPSSIEWIEQCHANQGVISGLSTGFVDLDKMTNGLQKGELSIIAARPSVGKSSMIMNIADHVAVELGKTVAVFSLEMTSISLITRSICARARVNMRCIRDGFLADRDFPKIKDASLKFRKAPLFIDDASAMTVLQLSAKARRLQQQHGLALIIVDYLQLLRSGRKSNSREQEVSEISSGLKALAKDLKVPVLAACQLNRDVEKGKGPRRPRMSDIRESGAIEQNADLIGLLYRPDGNEEESEQDSEACSVNLIIAKQRNGPTGDVRLCFLRGITRFESAIKVDTTDHEHTD